jgi:hypothetical protein
MKNVILFRKELATEQEFEIANKYFNVVEYRSDIPKDCLVFGRYSVLPYYKELEYDVNNIGSKLINSFKEHYWIADFQYYDVLKDFTFPTWFNGRDLKEEDAPFVVKGRTNSRKFDWDTLMFAKDKKSAINIGYELSKDSLVGNQGILYRKYEKLITYEVGLNGLPFTKEFRFFFYKKKLLTHGYYWSIADDVNITIEQEGIAFAQNVANIASEYVNFFVIDVAQKENGEYVMIELNDACMSGVSNCDIDELYKNLKNALIEEAFSK